MTRTANPAATTCLAAALLAVAGAALCPAGAPTTTRPAAATAPATRGAAKAPAPAKPPQNKPQDEDDEAVPQALIDAANRSFVVVKFHLKKDTSETPQTIERDYRISRLYDQYVDQKRPAEVPGLVLDDQGHVLVVDTGLEDRFIERIEVAVGGKTLAARRSRLLFGAPGVLLKVDAKAAATLSPLRFVPLADRGVNTSMLQCALYQADDEWRLRFAPLRPSTRLGEGGGNVFFGYRLGSAQSYSYSRQSARTSGLLTLLADKDGAPVGCATTSFIDLRQAECLWKGGDLLRAGGIGWPDLTRAERACRQKLIAAVHEVVLVLRQGAEGTSGSLSNRRPSRYSSGRAAGQEISVYGVAVSPTEIVVPRPLDSKMAREIDRLYLKHSPTRREDLQFVGAYREIGGFVVRLAAGKLPAHVVPAGADPKRMRPFWMARTRKRFGRKYVDLSTNRLFGKARGYEGRYHWYAARPIQPGTILVDLDGRLIGICAHERIEHEEERRLAAARSYRGTTARYRVFTVSELRGLLTKPLDHLDPKIKIEPRTLAKRRAWLGVEFVPMTGDLAEMLGVETPTKDGQLGFLVNAVYADSPAEKLGLKVGDILLRLQAPGMPYPIQLASRLAASSYSWSGRWSSSLTEEDAAGPVAPTWKNRLNFLTRAFDAIGVGRTVQITYYRREGEDAPKGKTHTTAYKIALAPPDSESAPKWKNRKLGLTVKDATYEIRHALNLQGPAPGVIVAKVETGSPTVVARIFPNEIVTRLNDQPLASARQMRDLIAAARQAGRDKVRLTILRLGKTRFADLAVTDYDPADDEGLDEGK